MIQMEVETISSTYIKPSTQTPPHLKTYNLSGLDQVSPSIYGPAIFFYAAPTRPQPDGGDQRSLTLKLSLSDTLSRYYPLAGKFRDDGLSIDCSHSPGAYYAEATIISSSSSSLSQFLGGRASFNQLAELRRLFPLGAVDNNVFSPPPPGSPVLLVQETSFPCGGVTIAVLVAHSVLDAASVGLFLRAWAAAARRLRNPAAVTVIHADEERAWNPVFGGESIFPQNHYLLLARSDVAMVQQPKAAAAAADTRRFVFQAPGLASLKEELKKSTDNNIAPSRVEAVTALLCESILRAFIRTSRTPPPPTAASVAITQAVNLRRRANPPLPSNSIGNYIINAVATLPIATAEDSAAVMIMKLLRDSVSRIDGDFTRKIQGTEGKARLAEAVKEEDAAVGRAWRRISFTSWSRVGWYEAADFGWGDRPVWMGSLPTVDGGGGGGGGEGVVDLVVIMDTRDGSGLEAWVYLKGDEIAVLEDDEKLLSFACLDPSPL